MAQGASNPGQNSTHRQLQQGLQTSATLAQTDVDSTGSSISQTSGGPPAINILLLSIEQLQSWLPQNVLVRAETLCS